MYRPTIRAWKSNFATPTIVDLKPNQPDRKGGSCQLAASRQESIVGGQDFERDCFATERSNMRRLVCLMPAQVVLAVSSTCQAALVARQASASQSAELRVNEIMKALSTNNYGAATVHFDPAMRAAFSPERIGSM